MYLGLSELASSTIEGGREVGICRKLYGRVTAAGRERKGETVRGTWARNGCGSTAGQREVQWEIECLLCVSNMLKVEHLILQATSHQQTL